MCRGFFFFHFRPFWFYVAPLQVKKHVRSFHSEKVFQCTECEKAFCRPDKLRLHMLRHSDRKDFLCSTCGKQFKVGLGPGSRFPAFLGV